MEPSGWTTKRLGELGQCIAGLTYSPVDVVDDGLLVLRSSNIQNGRLAFADNVYVRDDIVGASRSVEGDILVCVRNGSKRLIGKTALLSGDFPESTHGAFMSMYRSFDYKYVFQLFQTDEYKRQVHRNLGATINSINGKDFLKFSFPYPPSAERDKIASVLETWDTVIDAVGGLIRNSLLQKKALMQQLLTGKRRLPGFDADWREERINEISKRVQREAGDGEYPVLMISSTVGFLRQNQKYSRYMAGKSVDNYILLKKGEFAYNKGNSKTYEFGCVFPLEEYQEGLVPHVYVCIKLADECDHDFYKHLFEFDYLKRQLGRVVNTGVRNNGLLNIRPEEFLKAKVPVPPIDEQKAIATVIRAANAEIENYEFQLDALKQQKNALMQQLLTGKRRVKIDKAVN